MKSREERLTEIMDRALDAAEAELTACIGLGCTAQSIAMRFASHVRWHLKEEMTNIMHHGHKHEDPNDAVAMLQTGDRYDYANQAWMRDGKYLRCGHHEEHDCQCFGRVFQGLTWEEASRVAMSSEEGSFVAGFIIKPQQLHP